MRDNSGGRNSFGGRYNSGSSSRGGMLFASADHRVLMPASMLTGAALLLVCDLIAKLLALPINTITALMGIPVVIYVVVRNRNIF